MTSANLTAADSSTRTSFYYAVPASIWDTAMGQYGNLTYQCYDAWGDNATWSNRTGTAPMKLYIDTKIPIISQDNVTLWKNTTDAKLRVKYNVTDLNFGSCWVNVYNAKGDTLGGFGTSMLTSLATGFNLSSTTLNNTCDYNITIANLTGSTPSSITKIFIEERANDTFGWNSTYSAQSHFRNNTGILYPLKANQWNLIATFGNETFRQICERIPYGTYIAWYNNTDGYRNFTTYACNAATSAGTIVPDGNGIYVAVSQNANAVLLNYTIFNAPATNVQWSNSTAAGGLDTPWNIIPVYNWSSIRASSICGKVSNSSYVTYHNITDNLYYSYRCEWTGSYDYWVPAGAAVWLKVNETNIGTHTTASLGC